LQTILVGQPELRTTLRSAGMRQFAQRIAIDYHIGPLQREETHAYIKHRLGIAGGSADLIAADAREMVYASTGGVPRLINQICDTALVYGYAEQQKPVDAETVGQVLRDRGPGGILPLVDLRRAPDGAIAAD
jgi:type II secretory pathway predicted ATPase ExeA